MIVVYKSSTGFTKAYAEWIGEALGCPVKALNKVSPNELSQQDTIIYGGWIMGGMIMGLNKIRKSFSKNLIVYAVGASSPSEEIIDNIVNVNTLGVTPFFYLEGGFHYDQLGFFKKKMLGFVKKSVEKKTDRTKQDEEMLNILGTSFDNSDKKFIDPLVNYVKSTL